MWGWISLGIVVLALIVLAVVLRGTVVTLRPLQAAMEGLQARRGEVERTQQAVTGMQANLADVAERVQVTKERAEALRAARGEKG
jgi:hypothetical protein